MGNLEIVRLMGICNGSKRIISTSAGLGLLQTVLESNTGWCVNDDVGPPRGVDYEILHQLWKEKKHSL